MISAMKKLLLLLLFIPLMSIGQDESTIDLNFREGKINKKGILYQGNGQYSLQKNSGSKKSRRKKVYTAINEYARILNANITIMNEEYGGSEFSSTIPYLYVTFELRNKDYGYLLIDKNEAKKELLSLKEYLDLGIITQQEFDTKAVSLKKILLGN